VRASTPSPFIVGSVTWIHWAPLLPWVRRGATPTVVPSREHDRLIRELAEVGFTVLLLAEPLDKEDDFHRAIARLLTFPDYYGRNWDAFNDSVREWALRDDAPVAIVWTGWEQWLRADVPGFVRTVARMTAVNDLPRQLEVFMAGPEALP